MSSQADQSVSNRSKPKASEICRALLVLRGTAGLLALSGSDLFPQLGVVGGRGVYNTTASVLFFWYRVLGLG